MEEHSGCYEDYRCSIEHVFSTNNKAQQYIDKSTKYWSIREQQSKKCEQCPLYFNVDLSNVKNKDLFIQKSIKKCKRFAVDDDKKHMTCYEMLWHDSIPSFKIREYEIE